MLSLLIPTINYNVFSLVSELQKQCESCGVVYEIIVLDDGSTLIFSENENINTLENCRFLKNEENTGRASNINMLVALAQFDFVLILEADAFPSKKNYIQLYLDAILQKPDAVFGGVIYAENQPKKNALLRWIYGNYRESKDLTHRLKNPFDIVFSWNLVLKKSVFLHHQFDASITTYGFEDLVFLKKLKSANVKIIQIENTLVHQNEEESIVFIEKSKTATSNLIELYQKNVLSAEDSSLLKAFEKLNTLKLAGIMTHFFIRFEPAMQKNLLSEKPSLFIFDLFRLGYFCQQIQLKNHSK